jgi:hypothetical protein
MQNVNVIYVPNVLKLNVTKRNRPFSNNFTQKKFITINESDLVELYVTCTSDSNEPGRIYFCEYTKRGKLISCCTLN